MKNVQPKRNAQPYVINRRDISEPVALLFFDAMSHDAERFVWQADWNGLVNQQIDPVSYRAGDFCQFKDDYWACESWSKFPFVIDGVDPAAVAMTSFWDAELRCRTANGNLTDWFSRPRPTWMRAAVKRARNLLFNTLNDITVEEVIKMSNWGPGSTTALNRRSGSPQNKWVNGAHITNRALPWYDALRKTFRGWSHAPGDVMMNTTVNVVEVNLVTTVPKNAKTDRTIAIEPCWNSFFQHGIGDAIRRRLYRRHGLLGNTAQALHQKLACEGSLNGTLATIDLKGASDSVSLALCELLLPPMLNRMLLSVRSDHGLTPTQEIVTYEKMSSMGNGATFEVETAVFYSLAVAVCGSGSAYGDDIIVPRERAPMLVALLNELGFEVNQKKTHLVGHFRESCGGHYFNGLDVTPPYFKKQLNSLPRYIAAANRLRHCNGASNEGKPDSRFADLYQFIRKDIPRSLWGPKGFGDQCLQVSWDEKTPKWHSSKQCYEATLLQMVKPVRKADPEGALLHFLWGLPERVEREPDDKGLKAVVHKSYVDDWPYMLGYLT